MDKKAKHHKDTATKRQPSLNLRASSAASDSHKPAHASSPAAIKLNLHDIKISANTSKAQPKKIAFPKKNGSIDPPKSKTDISKQSFQISNTKTINSINAKSSKTQSRSPTKNKPNEQNKNKEVTNRVATNSVSSTSSNNHETKEKCGQPAFTERKNIDNDEYLLIFSSRENQAGRKSLVSLCLKPNSSVAFHLGQQLQGKSSFVIKKSGDEKKANLNNTDALTHIEGVKKWDAEAKVRHISNKTDIDFYSASTTEKTSTRETSLQHLNNDLGMIKEKVRCTFSDYRMKMKAMAERMKQLSNELADVKGRLSKYEKTD